jgi:exodeoxyribonuclease III
MRLGTWNSQTGLAGAWNVVEKLHADVLSVQECGPSTQEEAESRVGWTCQCEPGTWGKGVGVIARDPYRIEEREPSELPFLVSTKITGRGGPFRFVGFWAMTPKDVGYSYTRQARMLIEALPDDEVPTVVAGDFNASRSFAHLTNVRMLEERGLVSAYHTLHGVAPGSNTDDATSFHMWNQEKRFHMDFVFVPREWHIQAVGVGSFEDYAGAGLSDHVPVVVTVSDG